MFCHVVFHGSKQLRVFPFNPIGNDWLRSRTLAIEFATNATVPCTVEYFGATDVGTLIWE